MRTVFRTTAHIFSFLGLFTLVFFSSLFNKEGPGYSVSVFPKGAHRLFSGTIAHADQPYSQGGYYGQSSYYGQGGYYSQGSYCVGKFCWGDGGGGGGDGVGGGGAEAGGCETGLEGGGLECC